MNISIFRHVRLAAISTVVPQETITLNDELEYYGNSPEKARRASEITGLKSRRVAPDGVTAADLCAQAAEELLKAIDFSSSEIDALIFLSESGDYPIPATASLLQARLGLKRHCAAFDMTAACTGYIHALWTAAGLLESGACRRIMICAGNATARFYNPANRIIAPLFGDAGTATICERASAETPMSFALGNDGKLAELFIVPGGGARIPPMPGEGPDSPFNQISEDNYGNPWTLGGYSQCWMNGMELFRAVVATVPPHIKGHLEAAGVEAEALDGFVLHQGNRLMVETIARQVKAAPEKAPWATLSRYGNQMCASLPAVLCDQYCEAISGPAPVKLMLCGFGAGLSWGTCLMTAENVKCLGVRDYRATAKPIERAEHIARWHRVFRGAEE